MEPAEFSVVQVTGRVPGKDDAMNDGGLQLVGVGDGAADAYSISEFRAVETTAGVLHFGAPKSPAALSPLSGASPAAGATTTTTAALCFKQVAKDVAASRVLPDGRRLADDPLQEMKVLQHLNRSWRAGEGVGGPTCDSSPFVRLHALLETEDSLWIVMDRAKRTCFDAVEAGGQSEADVRRWFRQLMAGLRHMHACNLVHRDLSLENLLVDANNDLKLCDFGLACTVGDDGTVPAGSMAGKSSYLSPQALSGSSFDGRAHDVWAAGVCLFTMLMGAPPFTVATPVCPVFACHQSGDAEALRSWMLGEYPNGAAVSREALNFALWVLTIDAAARPSVDAVLAHPWLNKATLDAAGPMAGSPGVSSSSLSTTSSPFDTSLEESAGP